jgi:hypothetical protein
MIWIYEGDDSFEDYGLKRTGIKAFKELRPRAKIKDILLSSSWLLLSKK